MFEGGEPQGPLALSKAKASYVYTPPLGFPALNIHITSYSYPYFCPYSHSMVAGGLEEIS